MTPETSVDSVLEEDFAKHRRELLIEHHQNPWKNSYWRLHENEAYQRLVQLGSKAFPHFRVALEQVGPDALFLATAVVTIVQVETKLPVSAETFKYTHVETVVEYAVGLINTFPRKA